MAQKKRGRTASVARWFVLPFVRPIEQMGESAEAIRRDIERIREWRELQRQRQAAELAIIEEDNLADPSAIKNPKKRFEAFYELRGWTEDQLATQLGAFKITKRACVVTCLVMMAVAFYGLFKLPGLLQILMAPVMLTIASAMLAKGFRYGLLQSQLEMRSMHKARDYMARPDFFWHLFWG